jgi:hypothetical protein
MNQENSEIFSPDDLNFNSVHRINVYLLLLTTVPKASTTEKVAVPKTSKKRGPRGPCKKNPNNSFFTQLNYYIIISIVKYVINASIFFWYVIN